jgi:hypothetical protein
VGVRQVLECASPLALFGGRDRLRPDNSEIRPRSRIEGFDGRRRAWHDDDVFARCGILWSWLVAVVSAVAQVQPMPDFQLMDENPNSPRYQQMVSPRDYRLQISAYYFGDAG